MPHATRTEESERRPSKLWHESLGHRSGLDSAFLALPRRQPPRRAVGRTLIHSPLRTTWCANVAAKHLCFRGDRTTTGVGRSRRTSRSEAELDQPQRVRQCVQHVPIGVAGRRASRGGVVEEQADDANRICQVDPIVRIAVPADEGDAWLLRDTQVPDPRERSADYNSGLDDVWEIELNG